MRFFLLYIVYGIFAIALQATWFHDVPSAMVRIDFLFMAVVALGFREEPRRALPIVAVMALMVDSASIAPVGLSLFSYGTSYVVIRAIIAKISLHSVYGRFVWIVVMSLTEKFVALSLLFACGAGMEVLRAWGIAALPQALLDGAVGLFFVPFLNWYGDLSWEKLHRPKGLVLK